MTAPRAESGPTPRASTLRDGVLLTLGTFTRIPVPPPSSVSPAVAGTALSLAPMIGALLGIVIGAATQWLSNVSQSAALAAIVAVTAAAWLTRALHLDGLADTADALGSGGAPERALQIARQPDIGPFGVVSLVLVLAAQATAIAALMTHALAPLGLCLAFAAGRLTAAAACQRGIPAARPDGLGAAVAGTVPRWMPWLWLVVLLATAALLGSPAIAAAGLAAAGLAGALCIRTAVRRLGGTTGDTLGWTIELSTTAALVVMAVAAGVMHAVA